MKRRRFPSGIPFGRLLPGALLGLALRLLALPGPPVAAQAPSPAGPSPAVPSTAPALSPPAPSAAAPLIGWIRRERGRLGLDRLEEDPALAAAAQAYAGRLLALGGLTHRGPDGSTPLSRFRAAGGTSLSVGEILGAGSRLEAVGEAWLASPPHREVLLKPEWTHLGAGGAREGERQVWVVMFTTRRVDELALEPQPGGGWSLTGRLRPGAGGPPPGGPAADSAGQRPAAGPAPGCVPLLISGVRHLAPQEFDPASGRFRFHLDPDALTLYHRLGCRAATGEVRITDVFYPERLPAAPGR